MIATPTLASINHDLGAMVAGVLPSLVRVQAGAQALGAGTVWHPQGLIITNAHVVDGRPQPLVICADGSERPARLLAQDREQDLAALAIDAHDLPTIELGDSRRLPVGTWVTALGHPWGIQNAATGGIVIGAGAFLPEMEPGRREWLALAMKMRPGHSGGALVDPAGRLVGINTMISGPAVSFAIPVHSVKRFLKARIV
ncbi:MAG: S1C family serine protease [Anaerolineales bacterium]